jgi:hypothetical protein
VTLRYAGLALFLFSVILLACLTLSDYAPDAARSGAAFRMFSRNVIDHRWRGVARLRMQTALTLLLGAAAVWIIATTDVGPDDKRWAYGTIGALVGYWAKGG